MKIALLNLPIDLNYGGNIQRYALAKVLKRMGHEVVHIQLIERKSYITPFHTRYAIYLKRAILSLLHIKTKPVFYERNRQKGLNNFMNFYDQHVPHTKEKFFCYQDLISYDWRSFDVFIVGSDQVWRPDMTKQFGIKTYFFSFVSNIERKKIAYAASLGNKKVVYSEDEISDLRKLYKSFTAVSVREKEAISILKGNKMDGPIPKLVLDPTLLLTKEDYNQLINEAGIHENKKKPFLLTYFINSELLDTNMAEKMASDYHLDVVNVNMNSAYKISIPQWIDLFVNAKFIITDSYHGLIFSLIFNKPFKLIYNVHGGISRITSVLNTLGVDNIENIDWVKVNNNIAYYRDLSFRFLINSIEQ